MDSKERHVEIELMHERGERVGEFACELAIPQPNVSRTIKRYVQLGNTDDRPHNGRKRTASNVAMRKRIRERYRRKKRRSKRRMVREH